MFWYSFLTLGLASKKFSEQCVNVRGKKQLASCQPFGPHFWNDVSKIRLTSSENLTEENDRQAMLASDTLKPTKEAKSSKVNCFIYMWFFLSTKTTKKILDALKDLAVLVILALYRKGLSKVIR